MRFKPQDVFFYEEAFLHKSLSLKNNNERLEYLGDAILSAVVAEFLFKKFPDKSEGFLTQMRTKIVNNEQLNEFAIELEIDKYIKANLNKDEICHSVTGKTLEALIGAIYLDKNYYVAKTFIIEKMISKYIDFDELETKVINYKSILIDYAQKEKKSIVFKLLSERIEDKTKLYKVCVLIDNNIMGETEHYSKKKAERIVAEIAYRKLSSKI